MAWTKIDNTPDETFGKLPDDANLKPLAVAVLLKAIEDLEIGSGKLFNDAKAFLCVPNETLHMWCSIAGVDDQAIIDRARRIESCSARPRLVQTHTPRHVPQPADPTPTVACSHG